MRVLIAMLVVLGAFCLACQAHHDRSQTKGTGQPLTSAGYVGILYMDEDRIKARACVGRLEDFRDAVEAQRCTPYDNISLREFILYRDFMNSVPPEYRAEAEAKLRDGSQIYPDGLGPNGEVNMWKIYRSHGLAHRQEVFSGVLYGKSIDCAAGARIAAIKTDSECTGFGWGVNKSWSIKVGDLCVELPPETNLIQACSEIKTYFGGFYRRDAIYGVPRQPSAEGPCNPSTLVAIFDGYPVPFNSKMCHFFGAGTGLSASIKVFGECIPFAENPYPSYQQACFEILGRDGASGVIYKDTDDCNPNNIIEVLSVTDVKNCAKYRAESANVGSIRIVDKCLPLESRVSVEQACGEIADHW